MNRKTEHLYVSAWYMVAGLLWITLLYLVAKLPGVHTGVQQATMNWWFGHNVLGLWFTPVSVGAIYYFLPKIIGRPVRSYNLSILGFWTLAFFYGQVGGHHLIGGPVPGWLITLSIVQSLMMVIPVIAFTINMGGTLQGRMHLARWSPTLRFMMFGGLMYLASSLQGSMEALRSVNAVAHFTHYTVGHAHLGAYGFVSMVLFGAIYFMMPRVLNWEWPFPKLITVHFWLSAVGIAIYFTSLTIGGWLQGLAMLDPARAFMESVTLTHPLPAVALDRRRPAGAVATWSSSATSWPWRCASARCAPAPRCSARATRWSPRMENEIKLAAGAMVALGVATAALVVLPYVQARDITPPPQLKPYTDAQLRGREVYIANGCVYCHSQQPRDRGLGPDLQRGWGRASVPGDYVLRQAPPAGQHAHRSRPVQHRCPPAQQGLAPRPPVPAAGVCEGLDHAGLPLPVPHQGRRGSQAGRRPAPHAAARLRAAGRPGGGAHARGAGPGEVHAGSRPHLPGAADAGRALNEGGPA